MSTKNQALKWLERAVAKDITRPVLTIGKAFSVYGQKAMVTADAYRLHIEWTQAEQFEDSILFKKSVQDALEGKYPDVVALIPSLSGLNEITAWASDLIQAVKLAMVFAKDSANSVKFSYNPGYAKGTGYLAVSALSSEHGDIVTLVDASGPSMPFEISLNGQYVLDALSCYSKKSGEAVSLFYSTSENAVLLGVPLEQIALIMPMAINKAAQSTPQLAPQPKPEAIQSQPTRYTMTPPQSSKVIYLDADVIVKIS